MIERFSRQFASSGIGLWYQGLETRERTAVQLLCAFLLASIFYLAIWQPIHEWNDASKRSFARQSALLEWMRLNEDAARRAGPGTRSVRGGGSLLGLVASSARTHNITLNRYQPEGSDSVSVTLNDESFDTLIAWLDELNRTQGITVRQFNVNRRNESGRISGRLLLAN